MRLSQRASHLCPGSQVSVRKTACPMEVKRSHAFRMECFKGCPRPAEGGSRSDFGKLVRGKYVARLQAGSNVVILDPEVAELFPNAAAVNAMSRSLAGIAKRAGSLRSRSR